MPIYQNTYFGEGLVGGKYVFDAYWCANSPVRCYKFLGDGTVKTSCRIRYFMPGLFQGQNRVLEVFVPDDALLLGDDGIFDADTPKLHHATVTIEGIHEGDSVKEVAYPCSSNIPCLIGTSVSLSDIRLYTTREAAQSNKCTQ